MTTDQVPSKPQHPEILKALEGLQAANRASFRDIAESMKSITASFQSHQSEMLKAAFESLDLTRSTFRDLLSASYSPAADLAGLYSLVDSPRFTEALSPSFSIIEELQRTYKYIAPEGFANQITEILGPTLRLAATAHLETLSTATLLGQATAAMMELQGTASAQALTSLASMGQELSAHYRSVEHLELDAFTLPSVVSARPSVEYFNAADLLASIGPSLPNQPQLDALRDSFRLRVETSTQEKIDSELSRLDPHLPQLLAGARQTLTSPNPDRIRHLCTSLRELSTQVLHHLAPDEQVRAWTSDPEHFHGGRPTRKARLLYVARAANQPPLRRFIEKDIDALMELLDLVQQGTHSVAPPFTDQQIRHILIRSESTICFLIDLSTME